MHMLKIRCVCVVYVLRMRCCVCDNRQSTRDILTHFVCALCISTIGSNGLRVATPIELSKVRVPGLSRAATVRPQLPLGPNPRTDDEFRTAGYNDVQKEGF